MALSEGHRTPQKEWGKDGFHRGGHTVKSVFGCGKRAFHNFYQQTPRSENHRVGGFSCRDKVRHLHPRLPIPPPMASPTPIG